MRRRRSIIVMMRLWLALLLGLWAAVAAQDNDDSGDGCDAMSIAANVPLSQLTPNTFYKICAASSSRSQKKLGASPMCGNGSAFGFFVSRPLQRYDDSQRILMEFAGGGACWSADTCQYQADYLKFPSAWNDFVGLSCSEIESYVNSNNDQQRLPISMLCAKSIGNVNLRRYTTIVVPYCTQDVHSGDNAGVTYNNDDDDDDNSMVVNHVGAHNLMAVLRYIYKNFPSPKHIVLTGCSAGGTALPLAYHMLHRHYNHFGLHNTPISVIADSPVYLTPTYFMENAIANWNPWTMIYDTIGFRYQKWQSSAQYPTMLWDYILRQGSNRDQWGFVTHTDDPVSQTYYRWMSGYNNRRRLDDNNDIAEQWWSELSESLNEIQSRHANVATFLIDENEGHCSFGLYYALQVAGFEDWAANILTERRRTILTAISPTTTLAFLVAVALGVFVTWSSSSVRYYGKQRQQQQQRPSVSGDFIKYEEEHDEQIITTTTTTTWKQKARVIAIRILQQCAKYPVTAGYGVAVTVYFWTMMIREPGLTHPINNPALGPTAIGLSTYGINNPSLIVYHLQIFRLITSSFLCSGILTYMMVISFLGCIVRPLEMTMADGNYLFYCYSLAILCSLLILGPNLVYAVAPSGGGGGASCSSMALILGLSAFWIGIRVRITGRLQWIHTLMTLATALILALIFTFNSWIILLAAIVLGGLFAYGLFDITYNNSDDEDDDVHDENNSTNGGGAAAAPTFQLRRHWLYSCAALYGLMFLVLLFRIRRPDALFVEPFYTGCDLKYSDAVSDFAAQFYSDDDDDRRRRRKRRWLEQENDGDDNNNICAQFCVPHLLSKGVTFGARRIFNFPIQVGTCDANGYEDHVADKTFKYFSYSLDVEIYQSENDNN